MNVIAPGANAPRRTRLVIIDDSAFMRVAIRKMVERDGTVEVVGEARDGRAGAEMVATLRPDVVTMDVEMPVMDGIQATRQIMAHQPTPVIMVSSITTPNAEATIKALREGAVDFVSKGSSFVDLDIVHIEQELRSKIQFWARHPLGGRTVKTGQAAAALPAAMEPARQPANVDLIVVGVSTGGPRTLPDLLRAMGRMRCPVVVAQHMPEVFTASFAKQMAQDTGLPVVEGCDGDSLKTGVVTVLRGGCDFAIRRGLDGGFRLDLSPVLDAVVHPSVNRLFTSAAACAGSPVAVILTGMGDDGTEGAKDFRRRRMPVLAQEPSCCVVGGMPGAAANAGAVSELLTIEGLGRRLKQWAGVRLATVN